MPKATSHDGTTIAYDKKGRGPLLILVLGALNKRGSGKKLTAALADDFTVISYDRRGRGDSTDTLPYATEREVEDIETLIDANGGAAYLYGHSSGAVLVLLAAQKLGAKIPGMALYELPYNIEPAGKAAAETYRHELRKLLATDRRAEAVGLFIKSVGVSDKQLAALKKLPMWKGLTAMAPTLAYDTIELMEAYPRLNTADIRTKALVMHGAASPAFIAETARRLADTLPQATVRSLTDQTHDVKAEVLAPVLIEFFA